MTEDGFKMKEDIDTAMAAEWCKANNLQLIITSGGGTRKDTGYKPMYKKVFDEMKKLERKK